MTELVMLYVVLFACTAVVVTLSFAVKWESEGDQRTKQAEGIEAQALREHLEANHKVPLTLVK